MRTFLFLGSSRDVLDALRQLPDGWTVDRAGSWSEVVHRLTSRLAPDVLLFTAAHLTDRGFAAIVGLRRKGFFVPAAVYLEGAPVERVHFAGRLHRHGVHAIFTRDELGIGVETLRGRAALVVRGGIAHMLGVSGGVGERLLALLDGDPAMLTASPDRLAHALGISRSGLYRGLRAARLPSPGALQALFRLWPGLLRIAQGGRGEDAAFEAGCPHYLSFRRAVATHLGLTIREVRSLADPRALLQRWARHHAAARWSESPPSMATRSRRRRGGAERVTDG
jgi:hypothetical protein